MTTHLLSACLHVRRALIAGFIALACAPALAITFTNNTGIGAGNTNYDGQPIVITNCTVTVDGPHTFASLEVAAGGVLTHSYFPGGGISNLLFVTNESQVLASTNPVTLLNSNVLAATVFVTDLTGTIDYTNNLDYLEFSTNGVLTELERTTNSSIPDGATVLVSYESVLGVMAAGLTLTVTSNVQVDVGGAIAANGIGYGGGIGPGAGGSAGNPQDGSGGGYGGIGGRSSSNAVGGATYGSYSQPTNVGSGGGGSYAGPGGPGGGLIEITAGGSIIVNGAITANGANGTNSRAGGGSGGSISLTASVLTGSGLMTANGGSGEAAHGGGGSGGRIAIQCAATNFTGATTALGGPGANIGGAGTIYTKLTGQNGVLVVDNGGQKGTNTTLVIADTTVNVLIRGNAGVMPSAAWSVGNLTIASNSLLLAIPSTAINLTAAGAITIQAGGGLIANAAGYAAGNGSGAGRNGNVGNYSVCGGGSYGGNGASSSPAAESGGIAYGSQATPNTFGSGGGNAQPMSPGGAGGGAIQITSSNGLVEVDGMLSANGGNGFGYGGGGGAGGTIVLTGGTLRGSGSITANGGAGANMVGGGGGGGRIALSPSFSQFAGNISAYGGGGGNWGGAGTVYLQVPGQISQLILDNAGHAGTNTPLQSASTADLIVRNGAVGSSSSLVSFADLYLDANGWLTPNFLTFSPAPTISFSFSGNATIEAGSGIVADFAGFSAGQGNGGGHTSGVGSTNFGGGGGHGGAGGNSIGNYATGGNSSDYVAGPNFAGAGGGTSLNGEPGGMGGGAIKITVTGAMEMDGIISANGGAGAQTAGGGGAGGSIWLAVGTLSGAGVISANGGNGAGSWGGGGGGGMIYIPCNTDAFAGTLTAYGGGGANWGGAGTILIQPSVKPNQLILDNGGHLGATTAVQTAVTTDLIVRGGAVGSASSPVTLTDLILNSNGWLAPAVNGESPAYNVTFTMTGNATIQAGGGIVADMAGYLGGAGIGAGHNDQLGVTNFGSGAGHGGYGGNSFANNAAGGITYDSITAPSQPGSGGGTATGSLGGVGGGVIKLTVTGTLELDGLISANGGAGSGPGGGGGSGGSIWLAVGSLAGAGSVSANGGSGAGTLGGGGGGGMIYIPASTSAFSGALTAFGGGGANWGGAGTILIQPPSQTGQLILDNGGHTGTNTPLQTIGTTDLIVRGGAIGAAASSVNFTDLILNSNGWLEPAYNSLPAPGIIFSVTGNATIQAGGGIVADFAGYSAGQGNGPGRNGEIGSTNVGGGGGHGGVGGSAFGTSTGGISLGDSISSPGLPGSGGGTYPNTAIGGSGGGVVKLTINGVLEMDGIISANGGNGSGLGGGGGAGGSIWLAVGSLAGTGSISANGGSGGGTLGGGGGGGMIYIPASTSSFSGALTAYGGAGANFGGAGTILIQPYNQTGQLTLDNGGHAGTNTLVQTSSATDLIVRGGAVGSASSSVSFADLTLNSNGWLAPAFNSALPADSVAFSFSGNAAVQAGGGIVADFAGYSGGQGNGGGPGGGHAGSTGYTNVGSGAGHGGNGGNSFGNIATGGTTYDSSISPSQAGSGGAPSTSFPGGSGGGMIHLSVNGTLQMDGVISANGGVAASGGGGGSGGSLWLAVGTLAGAGSISANGGSGSPGLGGGGGGGIVYVPCNNNLFAGTITAYGGSGVNLGGAGPITVQIPSHNNQLTLDNGGHVGPPTPVPFSGTTDLTLRNGAWVWGGGGSLTLGNVIIASNAVLYVTNGTFPETLNFSSATIQSGGGIIADFTGYAAGQGNGAGHSQQLSPNYPCGGAGHGGLGAVGATGSASAGGNAYDNQSQPNSVGSGGGTSSPYSFGGPGGGGFHLIVTGLLQNDGVLSANGGNGAGVGGGGGSGGSIYLTVGTLSGGGSITANGGSGAGSIGGGGAGGCIAIFPTANLFAGTVSAYGGGGANWGGAGTIMIGSSGQNSQFVLDNNGQSGAETPIQPVGNTALTLRNGAIGYPQQSIGQTFPSLLIGSNAWLMANPTLNQGTVNLTITGNATIAASGGIVTDGAGSAAGIGNGAGQYVSIGSSYYPCSGAGYGGYGATGAGNVEAGGSAYGSATFPINNGSGGGTEYPNSIGGAGGGSIRLTVNGTLDAAGKISANGGNGAGLGGGGGSGGSVLLTVGALSGAGSISANGGSGAEGVGGGGGGGRVSIGYVVNDFNGIISAFGGAGYASGGAGTIYTKATSQAVGQFLLDNGGLAGTNTPLSSSFGLPSQPFNLTVQNGASVASTKFPLLNNLTIASGGQLTVSPGENILDLLVFGNVDVAAGGAITVDGEGYPQALGPGAGQSTNSYGSGAGYGAMGGVSASAAGGVAYGSSNQPVDFGSGGGFGYGAAIGGSQGGGALRLNVGGVLTVDGEITSDGEAGLQDNAGGGSGGSIWVTAGTLTGGGEFTADGGAGVLYDGGGGAGGRIALYSQASAYSGVVDVAGGGGDFAGGTGTIYSSNVPALQILSNSPTGVVSNGVNSVTLYFNGAPNPNSFAGTDVSLMTPGGPLPSGSFSVSMLSSASYLVTFPLQMAVGNYFLTVGTNLNDLYGQPLAQAYTGTFAISLPQIEGTITDTNGDPLAGVSIEPSNGLPGATTDTNGNYALAFFPGSSFTVTPSLGSFIFVPASLSYTNISATITNQNYVATSLAPTLTPQANGTNFILGWQANPSVTYQIYSSTDLSNWQPYGGAITGSNGPVQVALPIQPVAGQFFSVQASY